LPLLFKKISYSFIFSVLIFFISTQKSTAQFGIKYSPALKNKTSTPLSENVFSNSYAKQQSQYKFLPSQQLEYNPKRDPKRLLYNTGLYIGASVVSFSILWMMPESVTNWDKEKMKREGIGKKWKENVKAGPVWDKDDWVLNYVMHPWFGGVYYMSARGSGFKAWESFAYSTLMSSVFWEYGIEAFAEVPSWQDVVATPVLGSVIGEGFFIAKKSIIKNDKKIWNSRALGRFTIFLMDPFNAFINGFGYKTKNKVTATSAFIPVGYDQTSNKTVWGMRVAVNF
jgi:hypothetical protein